MLAQNSNARFQSIIIAVEAHIATSKERAAVMPPAEDTQRHYVRDTHVVLKVV
jgi:hypothetical protein